MSATSSEKKSQNVGHLRATSLRQSDELEELCKKLLHIRQLRSVSAITVPMYIQKKKAILGRMRELVS